MTEENRHAPRQCLAADMDSVGDLRACGNRVRAAVRPAILAMAVLVATASAAAPEPRPEEARGHALVQEWCSMCHGVEQRQPEAMDVPAFVEVAARPGRDLEYLRAFLDGDHFPMTTYRLFPEERDDVAAFIASLRPR